MCKNVMVVGGPTNLVRGPLTKKLGEFGIEVGWHVSRYDGDTTSFVGIPAACDGVVVLTDMANHPLFQKVRAAAKDAGVPIGCIPRKWSIAEGLLRAQGVLDPVSNGKVPKTVSRVTIKQTAEAYIIEERKSGRNPKKSEVEAAVQRALGPKVQLHQDEYSRSKRRAAEVTPILSQQAEPDKDATPEDMLKEVHDWTVFLIDEDPSRVHNVSGLIKLVSQHTEVRFGAAKSAIEDTAKETILRWARRDPKDRDFRERMVVNWLYQWFKRWKEDGQDYPDSRTVDARGKQIFGVIPKNDLIKEARAKALGEWARDLIYTGKAQNYADMTWPDYGFNIHDLMKRGVLKHIPTAKMPMTSKLAVDELVNELRAKTVNLDLIEPPPKKTEAVEHERIDAALAPLPELVLGPDDELKKKAFIPPATSEEDMFTLASMVEEAVTAKLVELLSPVMDRLEAIEKKLDSGAAAGGQMDISALLDGVLNGSEVTGITVSIDPNSLRRKPQQGG